ncbi:leucyl aminopeptidase [Methylophilaceae bacterium]|jgi:leucyl aminopeptidase|nr:leucyl aminopeptidase [Methylophilaceae bacterium]
MKFTIKTDLITKIPADIITLAVTNKNQILCGKQLDALTLKHLNNILKLGDLSSKTGSTLLIHGANKYSRVILLRIGVQVDLTPKEFFKGIVNASKELSNLDFTKIIFPINQFVNKLLTEQTTTEYLVRALADQGYIINSLKTQNKSKPANFQVYLHTNQPTSKEIKQGLKNGHAISKGVDLTKDLGNLPPNICTPTYLASEARKLARAYKMKVTVLEQKQIEKLKMGSFLSVAKGSREAPKFIVLEHKRGPKNKKPVVLVGKGITFDAGGISIKPSQDMDEMKYDMGGAATVLGVMKTVGELNLPLNIIMVVPTCENLPDGKAVKPGDIVRSMSGQTIEVLNTDAEGRLILCDALTYSERFNPEVVIDVATLTGACVIALGHHVSAVFSNYNPLADELKTAGEKALDPVWQMPMWDEYQPQLNSNFADMANIGGRAGGSITAACFLSRFAKKYNWAHIDIAGTAWKSGKEKGSTGRPVSLLSQFLIKRTKN